MKDKIQLEKLSSKSGLDTLKINGYLIHSQYNPVREAQQLAKKEYAPHFTHIVFGYGCGYLVDALLEQFQFGEVLIVIDPMFDDELLTVRKEHSDVYIFNSKIIENLEFFVSDVATDTRFSYKVICTSNYDKVFPEIYKSILLKVKGIQYRNRTNDFTLIRYAQDWQRNFIENLYYLSKDFSLKKLHQAYNCPVIVASGGPSLSKQLPMLKKVRGQIVLIAAGSTVNSLLAEGIEADYVVSIDGGPPNYEHFKHLKLEKAHLIYSMQNHPGVRKSFLSKGYVLDVKGLYGFSKYLTEQVKVDLPMLIGGGTVAHVAFTIAQYISKGPIALIGQDLAYTNNLTHAANNRFARKIDEVFIRDMEAFQTEGFDGELIWTNPVFYSMKLEFEEMIKMEYPIVPFFNCTEGGIKLDGYEQKTFQSFCETFVHQQKVQIVNHTEDDIEAFDVEQLLSKDIRLYEKLLRSLKTGLGALAKNRSMIQFDPQVLKVLEKTDEELAELLRDTPIDSIISPITLEVLQSFLPKIDETPQEAYIRVSNQTKTLYKKLIEAIQFTKKCTEEILLEHQKSEG